MTPVEVAMLVRDAESADIAAIQQVGRKTWPSTYLFAGDDYIQRGLATWWSVDALSRSLQDTAVLVAVGGGELVGVGNIDLRGEIPVIWKLYVMPETQGAGVGSALMSGLLARVPSGCRAVRLEYLDGNERAARFYAARRFTQLRREPGERPGWPERVWVERSLGPEVPAGIA